MVKFGLSAHRLALRPQDAGPDGMKGAEPQPFGRGAIMRSSRSRISSAALLVKVNGRIMAGKGAAHGENMRKPGGEDARLAGCRPGQHRTGPSSASTLAAGRR